MIQKGPLSLKSSLAKAHKALSTSLFQAGILHTSFSIGSEITESLLLVPKYIVLLSLEWRIGLNCHYKDHVLLDSHKTMLETICQISCELIIH